MDVRRIPFSKEDEEKIANAAVWGIIAAITSIASTLLGAVVSLATSGATVLVSQMISVTITLILGIWLYQASTAFRKLAITDVADQEYLLEGFGKLRNYFMMTGIVLIIAICLGALSILGLMICRMRF